MVQNIHASCCFFNFLKSFSWSRKSESKEELLVQAVLHGSNRDKFLGRIEDEFLHNDAAISDLLKTKKLFNYDLIHIERLKTDTVTNEATLINLSPRTYEIYFHRDGKQHVARIISDPFVKLLLNHPEKPLAHLDRGLHHMDRTDFIIHDFEYIEEYHARMHIESDSKGNYLFIIPTNAENMVLKIELEVINSDT